MGVHALPEIMKGLMAAGMEKDMPAAVLQQGTCAGQKRILATVGTLETEVAKQGIGTPAIIMVGKVCALGEKFSWYESQPLFGEKIVVTRPTDRNSRLSEKLRSLGAEVLSVPAIHTVPVTQPDQIQRIAKALEEIEQYTMLVFTSPYGVTRFFELLKSNQIDIRRLVSARLAAIGSATAKEIEKLGMQVDIMPEHYDSRQLGIAVRKACREQEKILIPRAAAGSKELIEEIKKAKQADYVDLPIYETKFAAKEAAFLRKQMESGQVTMVMFTSASTVHGFVSMLPDMDFAKMTAVCIGQQTAQAAISHGMNPIIAKNATMDSMITCVIGIHNEKKGV
jgi:uroporphyrinogen III methyltransferase/synthase